MVGFNLSAADVSFRVARDHSIGSGWGGGGHSVVGIEFAVSESVTLALSPESGPLCPCIWHRVSEDPVSHSIATSRRAGVFFYYSRYYSTRPSCCLDRIHSVGMHYHTSVCISSGETRFIWGVCVCV